MALISVKNLVTPLTNKVHLGTLVFVVVLFATFRAAGGAISIRSSSGLNPRSTYQDPGARVQFDEPPASMDDLNPRNELKRLGVEPRRDAGRNERDDLIRSMTGSTGSGQKVAPATQEKKKSGTGDVYGELEKQLGLK